MALKYLEVFVDALPEVRFAFGKLSHKAGPYFFWYFTRFYRAAVWLAGCNCLSFVVYNFASPDYVVE